MLTTAVFDLGNVLIRYRPQSAFAGYLDDEAVERFMEEIDFHAWNDRLDGGMSFARAQAHLALTHPDYAHLLGIYRDNFHLATPDEVPGTAGVLRDLQAAGVRLLAITNFPVELFPCAVERFETLLLFEGIVVSGMERVTKPNPAIYRVLLDRYEVRPASAVFIDDKEVNVAAARDLGMRGIVFTDAACLRSQLADLGMFAQQP